MKQALVIATDLLRRARLEAAARAAGLEPTPHADTPVIVLLDDPQQVEAPPGVPVVAVVSHVDEAAIAAAEAAGYTVVTRSVFSRKGAEIVRELLS